MNIPLKPEDKEIEQLQKLIRNTPIQVDLIDKTMDRFEKVGTRRHKRSNTLPKRTRNTIIVTSATLAMTFMLVVGTGFISPTMAASIRQIPGMNSIFQLAGDLGLQTADEKGLLSKPNLSDTHDGLTLSVPEVMFDGTRVSIALERKTEEGSNYAEGNISSLITDILLSINGDAVNSYAPSNTSNSIDPYTILGKDNNSTILQFSDLRNQGGKAFPDKFELTITVPVSGIKQPFEISIPVEKNTKNNLVLTPSISRDYGDIHLKLEKIEFTPITTNITTRIVLPEHSKISSLPFLSYELFDEKGTSLKLIGGSGWSATDGNVLVTDSQFEPFKSIPKSITIKTYKNIFKKEDKSQFELDKNGNQIIEYFPKLEFTLPISK
ncbi:hypothetical protein ASL14_15010 [Paenibacillus sp. IHB B 3084]|uniref:DUF4179 domain-containing protein n=1 Tax=Paenibacillus sp. IHB B 3084 TaxID=867076 RepID=UPI00071EF3BA|nr:DUF4179 domain-containing protein [Paenibacillus sp. IHB B 3084]ALP37308.1 hypothetical protein ASL14_15010 [Paenibacillus sp. IHB B 3084]